MTYVIYDFEDDIIAVVHTEQDAQRIAKYYGGYYEKILKKT